MRCSDYREIQLSAGLFVDQCHTHHGGVLLRCFDYREEQQSAGLFVDQCHTHHGGVLLRCFNYREMQESAGLFSVLTNIIRTMDLLLYHVF